MSFLCFEAAPGDYAVWRWMRSTVCDRCGWRDSNIATFVTGLLLLPLVFRWRKSKCVNALRSWFEASLLLLTFSALFLLAGSDIMCQLGASKLRQWLADFVIDGLSGWGFTTLVFILWRWWISFRFWHVWRWRTRACSLAAFPEYLVVWWRSQTSCKVGGVSGLAFARTGPRCGFSVEQRASTVVASSATAISTLLISWLSAGLCTVWHCLSTSPV